MNLFVCHTECQFWGKWWLGLARITLVGENGNKTLWHLAIWKFTLGISFPARFQNYLDDSK